MDNMKTYLSTMFSTEGAKPTEIVDRLHMLGFRPISGNYDFVYEWDKNGNVEEIYNFADKVHEVLRGMNVTFKMQTVTYSDSKSEDELEII